MPTPIIRILLAGGRTANAEHRCHQNTIGGRAMPTPVLRILLAGGRTTNVEHSAIRILLAGGRTTQVEHNAIRILLAGGEDHNSRTQCHQNTISRAGGQPTWKHSANQNTISGREESWATPFGTYKVIN